MKILAVLNLGGNNRYKPSEGHLMKLERVDVDRYSAVYQEQKDETSGSLEKYLSDSSSLQQVISTHFLSSIFDVMGIFALILDEQNRILFANDAFKRALAITADEKMIGRRIGEVFNCIHVADSSEGCGNTSNCIGCGLSQAIELSKRNDLAVEKENLLTILNGNKIESIEYKVRTKSVLVDDKKLFLVVLQDISHEKRRDILERVFFHDLFNTITSLKGYASLLNKDFEQDTSTVAEHIVYLSQRIYQEVSDHRTLLLAESGELHLELKTVSSREILKALEHLFLSYYYLYRQKLEVVFDNPGKEIVTDESLLLRILTNMVKNAFESTRREHKVRVWSSSQGDTCTFYVWNEGVIPENVARQIFKRTFSTKSLKGRGLGTYSMKLFGEQYLGGRVSFTTSEEEGTLFTLTLPQKPAR